MTTATANITPLLMKHVRLHNSTIETSAIGFGCVSLTMHDDLRDALALLDEAYELGIRHFDVARAYGFGQAEGMLGQFLQGRRHRVTVTTKFGMPVPLSLSKHRRLIGLARRMAHRSKILAGLARRVTRGIAPPRSYGPAEAAASLEISLRELKTDYIDIFELHEGTHADARRDDLLDWLQMQVQKGTIRCFGAGVAYEKLGGDAGSYPPHYSVLQFDSDILSRNVEQLKNASERMRMLITFGVMRPLKQLTALARSDPARARHWGGLVGADLTDEAAVAGLLLQHAGMINPSGITLFGTTKIEHLRQNLAPAAAAPASAEQLTHFAHFARESRA